MSWINKIRELFIQKPLTSVQKMKANGQLVEGQNCRLDGLNISVQSPINGQLNIRIGNNCILSGKIILLSPTAEVVIGDDVFIGQGSTLFCYEKITIGNNVMVSWGCTIIDTNAHSLHSAEREMDVANWLKGPAHKDWSVVETIPVTVHDKCWVGFNTIITKGVTLNKGTVVGCGSVVTKSTDSFSVYAGNPAILIKKTD